jgi:hypothetical protein
MTGVEFFSRRLVLFHEGHKQGQDDLTLVGKALLSLRPRLGHPVIESWQTAR